MAVTIFTIGHSTRSLKELVSLLRLFGVQMLVDIRSVPRSRKNPQFNREALASHLPASGIGYVHLAALGGLRGRRKGGPPSRNAGWTEEAFRNYADYAETAAFAEGLRRLLELAREKTCAIMCAEAVWWRCHRRITTDYLLARGLHVRHILGASRAEEARLTPFAVPQGDGTIAYRSG